METEKLNISVNVNSDDMLMFTEIINQGIDARLEAFTESKFYQGENGDMHRYYFDFDSSEIQILLRRLLALDDESADDWSRDIVASWYDYNDY